MKHKKGREEINATNINTLKSIGHNLSRLHKALGKQPQAFDSLELQTILAEARKNANKLPSNADSASVRQLVLSRLVDIEQLLYTSSSSNNNAQQALFDLLQHKVTSLLDTTQQCLNNALLSDTAQTRHEPPTALPNRVQLIEQMAQRCGRAKDQIALIIVDLHKFSQINDIYGRETGDKTFKQTQACLESCMPDDALITRTADDEFAVLVDFSCPRKQIEHCALSFLSTLKSGLNATSDIPVCASVGIAFKPEHGDTASSLLTCADSACAYAKQLGNNSLAVYNSEQQRKLKRNHQLEIGLQKAIAKNELHLNYQPKVDIATGMTCGMEALLRWNSPEFGNVSPAEFITVAEDSDTIKPISNWVLRKAITDYQHSEQFGMSSPQTLSVNLSRKQLHNSEVVKDVAMVLNNTGFDPQYLCLEITETALCKDAAAMRKVMRQLRNLGVQLSIDDFGVGYTTLAELRDYRVNEIKIDRDFVTDVNNNHVNQHFIRTIVDLAKSIGANVVAEGIENQEQLDMVAELGCHRAQGYYLSRPMCSSTFSKST